MEKNLYKGYELIEDTFEGRTYKLLLPKEETFGKNWVWRAEFFGAFDYVDLELVKRGWYVAYYCVSDMYGNDESVELMKKFHDFITAKYSLAQKADIFGFSRGGLYSVNYTSKYPEDISTVYLDAPVLDIRSWPAGLGLGLGDYRCWDECKDCYNIHDVRSIVDFNRNPLDKIDILAQNKIPVVICAGGSDRDVPYSENGEIFDKKYRALGGDIMTIVKPDCEHHPHSIQRPQPIADFIEKHRV